MSIDNFGILPNRHGNINKFSAISIMYQTIIKTIIHHTIIENTLVQTFEFTIIEKY